LLEAMRVVQDLSDPRRVEPPFILPERAMLEAWLEFHRTTLLLKCEGLDDEGRKDRPVKLIKRPLGIGRLADPPTFLFQYQPGPATLATLVPGLEPAVLSRLAGAMREGRAVQQRAVDAIDPALWARLERVVVGTPELQGTYDALNAMTPPGWARCSRSSISTGACSWPRRR